MTKQNADGVRRVGLGLMSGSSCDGVAAALVRLEGSGASLKAELIVHKTYPYAAPLREKLLAPEMSARQVCLLNVEIGRAFAKAASALLGAAPARGIKPDFIASHGHTVSHVPPKPGAPVSGTLQIGEAAVIAEETGIPVVSGFRGRDMAVGGQGAPLTPYADWALFRRPRKVTGCLNIGGIANLSVVTSKLADVFAFDTGPGNLPIDGAVLALTDGRHAYDKDGEMAARGAVLQPMLEQLLRHPFFGEAPPKSTGREEFGPQAYLRQVLAHRSRYAAEDIVATVTRATAASIADAYRRFVAPRTPISRLVLSGGGAHNKSLIAHLRHDLEDIPVLFSDELGYPGDAREALAFAILAHETLNQSPANVPGATGARKAVILGQITPGK